MRQNSRLVPGEGCIFLEGAKTVAFYSLY